jgi:cardiolipin synthase (CMP-forming)
MRKALKSLPNALSATRLVLLVPLWVLAFRGEIAAVGWLLVVAGATDVLDGWLARRLGATSAFGAQLDSLADNLLAPSGAAWLVMLRGDLVDVLWAPLFTWLCFYAAFMAIGWIRFRRFGNLHLWSAKAAAVVQYAFVVHAFLIPGIAVTLFATAFALSMISLLEGLAVQLMSPRVDEHAGSLLLLLGERARARRPAPRSEAGPFAAERIA